MLADSFEIPTFISNSINFGYILQPLGSNDKIVQDFEQLLNIKLNIINDLGTEIEIKNEFKKYLTYPEKNKLSLDHIYVINLERRPERKRKMELSFKELNLDVEYFPAIDGTTLNLSKIEEMGIKLLPEYEDPFHRRQITTGEIGCFLSHYNIWEKIIELSQQEVLIFEDDLRFEPNFSKRAINILNQARKIGNWDLLYFGRIPVESYAETWVKGAKKLIYAPYSQGACGYVITLKGAKKLIDIKPLEKLLPVDEFISIMFNQHPYASWKNMFETRNLLAYSAKPLLVRPSCNYDRYKSDTANSEVIPLTAKKPNQQRFENSTK